jgi:hypothetical protein
LIGQHQREYGRSAVVAAVHEMRASGELVIDAHGRYKSRDAKP